MPGPIGEARRLECGTEPDGARNYKQDLPLDAFFDLDSLGRSPTRFLLPLMSMRSEPIKYEGSLFPMMEAEGSFQEEEREEKVGSDYGD